MVAFLRRLPHYVFRTPQSIVSEFQALDNCQPWPNRPSSRTRIPLSLSAIPSQGLGPGNINIHALLLVPRILRLQPRLVRLRYVPQLNK